MKAISAAGGWSCGTEGHPRRAGVSDSGSAAAAARSAATDAADQAEAQHAAERRAKTDDKGRLLLHRDLVSTDFMSEVTEKIKGINRRARRPVMATEIEQNPDYDPSAYDPEQANIEVLSPHIASVWALPGGELDGSDLSGYRRVGAWDFAGDGEPLAYGDELDRANVPDPRVCDHCGTGRKRNMVFVFEDEEGNRKHIGSNCVKDITGASASNMLWLSKYLTAGEHDPEFVDWLNGRKASRESRGGGKSKNYDVRSFVAASVIAVQSPHNGGEYVSADRFNDREHVATTKNLAIDEYRDQPVDPPGEDAAPYQIDGWRIRVETWQEALSEADQVIAWARDIEPSNNFEENLQVIARSNEIGRRALGLAAYLPEAHRRSQQETKVKKAVEEVPEELVRSAEVPIGRIEHTGRILAVKVQESRWGGVKALIRCGPYDLWGTMPRNENQEGPRLQKGDKIVFTCNSEQSDEVGFGFFQRPSRATVVESADAAEDAAAVS